MGLFLFALLGISMASGFIFLIGHKLPIASGIISCAACFGMLELLIKDRRLYHCGADNTLL